MSNKYFILIFLILGISLLVYKAYDLRRAYQAEVQEAFHQLETQAEPDILTEQDLVHLPDPVQKYLRYTGVVGKEKVKNFRLVGEGEFKTGQDKKWVKARAEQYNFIEDPKRVYYMKLNMSGLPAMGLHVYKDETAIMQIKVAGLITVGDAKGEIMNKAETVTVFNDMCLMAPATLIDKRIVWETVDPFTVKASFTNKGIEISAELHFNEKGELVNFISNDRYMTTSGDTYENATWSTPVRDYKEINGIKIASYGEAYWQLPEGDFCYGRMHIKEVQYNLKSWI